MPSMFEKSVSAWRGGRPVAHCPRTGLGVPECSCPHCISEQVRQHRPELLSGQRLELTDAVPLSTRER